ncbi:MAG TPA: gluconokinase [Candidatus Binatia bacterium]
MIIIIMGVSGSGKSTIGSFLASVLGWSFVEADDFHSQADIEKMTCGVPLDDEDRAPWLQAIRQWIEAAIARGENGVIACSALKQSYREILQIDSQVRFVYLEADAALIEQRLRNRVGHFMNPSLIASQFATLEEPNGALKIDASLPPGEIVTRITQAFTI